jgi:hypothetical protein
LVVDEPPVCLGRLFFHAPTPTVERHPVIVVSDPLLDRKRIVVVNLSTKPGPDVPPCIVHAGEHPAISQRSYVRCERAGMGPIENIERGIAVNFISLSHVVSDAVLARVQRAILESDNAAYELKGVLEEQGFPR